MTNNLKRRISTHCQNVPGIHTGRYAIYRLVYFEYFRYVRSALAREKQMKHGSREQKIDLIEQVNPTLEDLYLTLQEPICQQNQKQIPCGNDRKKGTGSD